MKGRSEVKHMKRMQAIFKAGCDPSKIAQVESCCRQHPPCAGRIVGGLAWLFSAKLWASVCLQCSLRTFQASSFCSSCWSCDLAPGSQGWKNADDDDAAEMMMTTTTTMTPPMLRLLRLLLSLLQLLRISEPSICPLSAFIHPVNSSWFITWQ